MRVHLAVLLSVCIAPARTTGCGIPWEFPPITGDVAGPSLPGSAPVASTASGGAAVTQFCAGYQAGTIQGWKDLRGQLSTPEGHVSQDILDECPKPVCGSESYQDGYAAGRPVGVEWARRYP
jgi:hypothetical protein